LTPLHELTELKARFQRGRDKARKEHRYAAGGIPYGAAWLDHTVSETGERTEVKSWIINEKEYSVLKKILEMLKDGHTIQAIANLFNSDLDRYPTKFKYRKNKKSGEKYPVQWFHQTIWNMLQNDFYFTGVLSNGLDTGIVLFSEEEITEIRKLIKLNRRGKGTGQPHPNAFLLKRMITCECGWIMSATPPSGKNRYYRCKRCKTPGMKAAAVDKAFWNEFCDTYSDKNKLMALIKGGEFASKTEEIKAAENDLIVGKDKIKKADEKQQNLVDSLKTLQKVLNQAQIEEISEEIKGLRDKGEKLLERATFILNRPKDIEAIATKASKLFAKEFQEVDELMVKFATNVEARKLGVPSATMREEILKQKRSLIKSRLTDKGIQYKDGDILFNGTLLLPQLVSAQTRNG